MTSGSDRRRFTAEDELLIDAIVDRAMTRAMGHHNCQFGNIPEEDMRTAVYWGKTLDERSKEAGKVIRTFGIIFLLTTVAGLVAWGFWEKVRHAARAAAAGAGIDPGLTP